MAGTDHEAQPLLDPGTKTAPKFDRASLKARWMILFLCSVALTGNYYCYDNPSALKGQLKDFFDGTEYGGSEWETWFALLYSVYSFPNTILPFIGGFLVDRVGVRPMTIVFCSFIAAGQCIFALGGNLRSIPVMLVGRVVFGFGGESLTVASSAILSYWFKDKELALALGINLGVSRLGGVANNFVSPILWKHGHFSMWFGAILCGISLGAALIMVFMDKVAEVRLAKLNNTANEAKKEDVTEQVRVTDVQYFGRPFWLLTASCLVIYGTVLPFNNIASTFLQTRDFLKEESPWQNNISFIAPVCTGPDVDNDVGISMEMRYCGMKDNYYLGPAFMGADFSNVGNVKMGQTYNISCADGYENVNGNNTAVCVATADYDSWSGDEDNPAYWKVNGKGCKPKDASTCEHSLNVSSMYLHATGTKSKFNCVDSYCIQRFGESQCDTHSTHFDVTCNTVTGLPEIKQNYTCVPQLYNATQYCSAVDDAQGTANTFMSIPYLISIVISPLLGFGVDRLGRRALLATTASVALIAVHSVLGLTKISPYPALAGQGLAYSVFAAALWPSVPYAVEEQYCGTAYGVMTAIQNTGLATFPLAVAALLASCDNNPPHSEDDILSASQFNHCQDTLNNYKYSELFFVGLAVFGSMIGVWLYLDDIYMRGGRLNKAHIKKDELSAEDLKRAESADDTIN